jgi:predicted TIM-barrel fold metal-dependent hydrolase
MAEPPDLWEKNLPARFRDRAPQWPNIKLLETNHHLRAGGWDPHERLKDQAVDGVSAEVLYPTQGVQVWLVGDVELEEACIRVYNDWMIDFCSVAPDRFWGLAMISLWNVDHAVQELERCKKAGLRGGSIWIAPPEDLQYSSERYEPFWAAAQDLGMPLSMHINARAVRRPASEFALRQLHSVNGHKFDAMNALAHLIASGVMERYPRLRFSVAEVGVGWVPFWLQEFDYYTAARTKLPLAPSEYFRRQVYATFISDGVGCHLIPDYAECNAMWSNDYPHPACTWPDSAEIIASDLGEVSPEIRADVVANSAALLYNNGQLPPPVETPSEASMADIRSWAESHDDFGKSSRLKNAPDAGRVRPR